MSLVDLPSDVKLVVLSHLDLPSLARIVQTHSSFNSVWKSYPEHLSRTISIRTGLAEGQTMGAAAPLEFEAMEYPEKGLEVEPELDERELANAIRDQRSFSGTLNGVKTWAELAQTRCRVDRNWRTGRHKQELIQLDLSAAQTHGFAGVGFWRFKLDPVSGWIVVTGLLGGGLWAFDQAGQLMWYSRVPRSQCPHLELTYDGSNSFLCSTLSNESFLIWRFHDPSRVPAQTDPSPPSLCPAHVTTTLRPLHRSLSPTGAGYHPWLALESPEILHAFKLRYPFLVASTASTNLLEWDITDSSGVSVTLDLTAWIMDTDPAAPPDGEDSLTYLELDDDSIFIGGKRSVTIYPHVFDNGEADFDDLTRAEDVEHRTIPPPTPSNLPELSPLSPQHLYRQNGNGSWRPVSAVHHDSKSRFLVCATSCAATDSCVLSITYRYKGVWEDDEDELEQRTMNLCLTGVKTICQLSVENDRAVFVASSEVGHALFLLPLRPFENHTDFVSDAPKPICLAYPLPCIEEPSRVESTSTDIYLPIDHELFVSTPDPHWRSIHQAYQGLKSGWSAHGRTFPFDFKWKTLDGQTLVDYSDESVSFGSPEWMKLKRYWDSVLFAVFSARIDTFRCVSSLLRFSIDV